MFTSKSVQEYPKVDKIFEVLTNVSKVSVSAILKQEWKVILNKVDF